MQATCRDLECCSYHRCWGGTLDRHSKSFKSKKLARARTRVQQRGPKDHLPRAGRCAHVQQSSVVEGQGSAWQGRGGVQDDGHRGVFTWFKRMRRASERLPAFKDQFRAYVQAEQANRGSWWREMMPEEVSDPPTDSDDYDD